MSPDPTEHHTNGDVTPAGEDIAVGRVGRAHGIRGDVFVEPWTDSPEERFAPGAVLRTDPARRGPLTVEGSRQHSGKLVVKFEGQDDRNAVEELRGTVLVMTAAARPAIDDPDEFYDTDLIGLQVLLVDGPAVGTVTDVLHAPGNSLLAVDRGEAGEVLVPFLKQFVPVVDIASRRIEITPPDGLLDL